MGDYNIYVVALLYLGDVSALHLHSQPPDPSAVMPYNTVSAFATCLL